MTVSKTLSRYINAILTPVLLILALGFMAFISTQNIKLADMTTTQRLSLSTESQTLLAAMHDPVSFDIFVNPSDQIGERVELLIERFKRVKPDLNIRYLIPEEHPDLVREYAIRYPAEMIVHYQNRHQRIDQPSEQSIINALIKLHRGDDRWVVFLSGHGERDPLGDANFDYGQFTQKLDERGLKSRTLNLSDTPVIPDNTALLVIANPQVDLLENEEKIIHSFIENNGNVLILAEPDHHAQVASISHYFGIDYLYGVAVDAIGEKFNITQPDLIPITQYPTHPITQDFALTSLLANSSALKINAHDHFHITPLLLSSDESWVETSELKDHIFYDQATEEIGPLALAVAITSAHSTQRVVIMGDGDFLSNRYLGNGGNLDLGIRLFSWLSADDNHITLAFRQPSDLDFAMSNTTSGIIGIGALFVLPGLFLFIAFFIFWRRKRQ